MTISSKCRAFQGAQGAEYQAEEHEHQQIIPPCFVNTGLWPVFHFMPQLGSLAALQQSAPIFTIALLTSL